MLVVFCAVLFGVPAALAEDAKEKLDKAKLKAIKEEVGKKLDDREAAASKAGNKKIVDQVVAAREAFEKESLFPHPALVEVAPLKKQADDARVAVVAAYKAAVAEYTKGGLKPEAKAAEDEMAELQKAAAEVRLKEVFAVGTVLAGLKKNAPNKIAPNGTTAEFKLTVSERTGGTFKGKMTVANGTRDYDIVGEIEGDQVTFKNEVKSGDNFEQTFKGSLKGSQMELKYEGWATGTEKVQVKGTATLSPKK
jgi:hypothetical protein